MRVWLHALALCLVWLPTCLPAATSADDGGVRIETTPTGIRFGTWGGPATGRGPTLVILANSIEGTLGEPYFRQAGRSLGDPQAADPFLCVSIDLPCHGRERLAGEPEELEGWRHRLEQGGDPVADTVRRVGVVVDHLVAAGRIGAVHHVVDCRLHCASKHISILRSPRIGFCLKLAFHGFHHLEHKLVAVRIRCSPVMPGAISELWIDEPFVVLRQVTARGPRDLDPPAHLCQPDIGQPECLAQMAGRRMPNEGVPVLSRDFESLHKALMCERNHALKDESLSRNAGRVLDNAALLISRASSPQN